MKLTHLSVFFLLATIVGCTEPAEEQKTPEDSSIADKLPTKNRDFYLEPLENAFDDLKAMIDIDESYFSEKDTWTQGDVKASIFYKLNGNDTALAKLEIQGKGNLKEVHSWYYDKDGHLFYSEHEITNVDYGFEQGPSHRNYKLYFEEKGPLLSVYARTSFDGIPLPQEWTPVKITDEETHYLRSRLTAARKAQKEAQTVTD